LIARELHFTRTNGPVDAAIDQLIDLAGGVCHAGIVREMILAALKAGQENGGKADLKLMNVSLKEMRFTAKVFRPYRSIRKVSVFGSARTPTDHPLYAMARELGRRLAACGYMVITGGGPGIMQAVNEGAGPEHSFGVNIRLPFEQKANPILDGNPRSINYKYFFNRKVAFIKEASAIVLFPGGFGTMDEGMETLCLLQTGKRYPMPVVLVDQPGSAYWDHWQRFLEEQLLGGGFIGPEDLGLFERCDAAADAAATILRFYRRYHSLRYVQDRLVIRLRTDLPDQALPRLRVRFADLLQPGGQMVSGGPLPEEADEPDLLHLPRLILEFNNTSFGRLRQFLDALNAA
jgi:uncharacterized protein (TIGR00730 family)